MTATPATDWVQTIELPFGNARAAISSDWGQLGEHYHRIVPLRNFEPLRTGAPFLHRQTHLQTDTLRAVATAHSGLRLQGERTLAGMASLRFNLVGRARIHQGGQTTVMAPGRLLFDYNDNSSYSAQTDSQLMMVVVGLNPACIAQAAAALRGPGEDPSPYLQRLPGQSLFQEDSRATGIVIRQIMRILQLAERCQSESAEQADGTHLEHLLHRSLALLLFPEFLREH